MIQVRKLTGVIGAEISGVDVTKPLDPADVKAIKNALWDNLVVFFRNQKPLTPDEHVEFGRQFGTLDISEIHPNPTERPEVLMLDQVQPKGGGADNWHRDRTYLEAPPMGSILQCMMKPSLGGDTCWASMYEAYNTLSKPMQTLVDGLTALHTIAPLAARSKIVAKAVGDKVHTWPVTEHPMVEVHPETGRKALNVNASWTTEVVGLEKEESDMLLGFLFEHVKRPDFAVRFSWNVGDLAFWDNRATLHCAIADYNERRIMKRVAFVGNKPVGPQHIH
jgi:taurine dioxygenase